MDPKRRRFLSIISVISGAGMAGCASDEPDGGDGVGNQTDAPNTTEGQTPTENTSADGTTTESREISTVVGERVDGEQLSMVVREISKTSDLGQFQQAEEGNVYLVVELAVKNTTQDKYLSFSGFLQTRVKDDEDYTYNQSLTSSGKMLDSGQLAPGEVTRGNLVYEVPENATGLTLQFDFESFDLLDLDRVTVDLEQSAGSVATLDQNLRIPTHSTGDSVSYGNTEVTVNSVETQNAIGTAEPDEGNEFVVVDISTTNNTGEEQSISTLLQMSLKDGQGYTYRSDLMGTSQLDKQYSQGSPLADGETRRGKLAYEVEKGLSPLYWTFEFSLLTEGDKTFWKVR